MFIFFASVKNAVPNPTSSTSSSNNSARNRGKRRIRFRILLLAFLLLLLALILIPQAFQTGVRGLLWLGAYRIGVHLKIGKIEGNCFGPLTFYDVKMDAGSSTGTKSHIEIHRAIAQFSFRNFLLRKDARFFKELTLTGIQSDTRFAFHAPDQNRPKSGESKNEKSYFNFLKLLPGIIRITDGNFSFEQNDHSAKFSHVMLSASRRETGRVFIENIAVKTNGFQKNFRQITGQAEIEGSRLAITQLKLAPGIVVRNIDADLRGLVFGPPKANFDIAAFGGSIRGDLKSVASRSPYVKVEASGSFSHLSIQKIAQFFGSQKLANGEIKEGRFTFSGSLHALKQATISVWLNATDFRWGDRRWDSLTGGGTFLHGHLKIPKLRLRQAHNELTLNGDITLPSHGKKWWQSTFDFKVMAHIDKLSELTALFGPPLSGLSGKMEIDGDVRGENQSFGGQLIASGSQIVYHGVPFDTFKASISLNENELKIVNIELANGHDFLHGDGVVNILGNKRYWGELKASVQQLSLYAPLLKKTLLPVPLAGSVLLDWSGDGTVGYHSGAINAHFKAIRFSAQKAGNPPSLDADFKATYSPGNLYFRKFQIHNNRTSLTANVTVSPHAFRLQNLEIRDGKTVRLKGDALLPFDLWRAWKSASWNRLLEFDQPLKIAINAHGLSLKKVASLTGRTWPIKGVLDGAVSANGTLNALQLGGKLKLSGGEFAISEPWPTLAKSRAEITMTGSKIDVEKFHSSAEDGIDANGELDLKEIRLPSFKAQVRVANAVLEPIPGWKFGAALDLHADGTFANAHLDGTAKLKNATAKQPTKLKPLLAAFSSQSFAVICKNLPAAWKCKIAISGSAPLGNGKGKGKGKIEPQLVLRGTAGAPLLYGHIHLDDIALYENSSDSGILLDSDLYFDGKKPRTFALKIRQPNYDKFQIGTGDVIQSIFSIPHFDERFYFSNPRFFY